MIICLVGGNCIFTLPHVSRLGIVQSFQNSVTVPLDFAGVILAEVVAVALVLAVAEPSAAASSFVASCCASAQVCRCGCHLMFI